jgi:ABC-type uncharacterized transport system auxiliary subunit
VTRGAIPSSSNLKIEVDLVGKDTMVHLTGRVDVDSSPDLRDRLRTLLVGEALPKTIIVDLAAVAVREFRASAYLRQGAIAYKPSPEQIGFYAYDRWAINPCDFVTDSVIERLRASGHFAHVKLYDGRPGIEYVLSGRLEKLEEIDYAGGVKVEVAISAQMTNLATGLTVWTNAVSELGNVNKRDVPAVVAEMNRTMERAIEKLLTPMPADVAAGPTAVDGR